MKRMQNYPLLGIALVIGLIFIVMPLTLDLFRLNLIGKYLTYAFVAVGLVLCWGYSGILSLGQGIFFGLGGYCMAMFLKLEASSPAETKMQTCPLFAHGFSAAQCLNAALAGCTSLLSPRLSPRS